MPLKDKKGREKHGIFAQIYHYNKETGSYIIEIALEKYEDLFCQWDPAPFKLRDIDPDLELYLEGCSDDIPFKYPVTLHFKIPKESKRQHIEEQARNGLKNGFRFKRYFIRQEASGANRRTLLFFLIGFALLYVATSFPATLIESPLPSILVEGLFIGGWVFIWEAISLILFTTRGLQHRSRTYNRLQLSNIVFRELEG